MEENKMVNNDSMDMILAKAQTLIEALPYIQKFNRKIIVVKYGGSAMSNEELQKKRHQGRNAVETGRFQAHHRSRRR